MKLLLLRIGALLLHTFLNIWFYSYLMDFDITGSWLRTAVFFSTVLLLLTLYIVHVISFIKYIKIYSR